MAIFKTQNPTTSQDLQTYALEDGAHLLQRLENAHQAYLNWKLKPIDERMSFLLPLAQKLREQKEELAHQLSLEMGKPIVEALAEVEKCAFLCEVLNSNASRWLAPQRVEAPGPTYCIHYRGLGVILGIMPWNFPYWQGLRFMLPSLLSGNAILLKPALPTAGSSLLLQNIFSNLSLPADLVQTFFAQPEQLSALYSDGRLQGISLTGSTGAGRAVASEAGAHLKKVVLELGGSDPFIVLESAHIQSMISHAVTARMQNNGQSCIAAKRFLVHRSLADQFLQAFVLRLQSLKIGDPLLRSTQIGPMVSVQAAQNLHEQVKRAQAHGANIYFQEKNLPPQGAFFPPTVLLMNQANPLLQEEFFGPVALVQIFETDDQAILLANDTPFGLAASVWGHAEHVQTIAGHLQFGMVFLNEMAKSHPLYPFGGIKQSGIGKELGELGIREFTNQQVVGPSI